MTGCRGRTDLRQWALVGILLLAFGLRLVRLGAPSLWYDETVSTYLAGQRLPDLVAHTARDIHPPGYYLLLAAWTRLAGNGEFAVAFLSLWFGLLLVALAYRLAARQFGPRAGLLAALLVAVSPYNLWYSQEVRMYTLGASLGMGVLLAVLSLLEAGPAGGRSGARPPWPALAAYALCAALGLWVLYYFAFLLLAVNLAVLLWWLTPRHQGGITPRHQGGITPRRRGQQGWAWLGRWAMAQAAVLVLYAPWLGVAWRQATLPPVPPWRGFTSLGRVAVQTWSALSLGQSVRPEVAWPVLVLVAVLFGLGLPARRGSSRPGPSLRPAPWLLAGYVFLPVLLIYLASFATPLYHVRYVFTYSTPFYVLVAAGLSSLWRTRKSVMVAALLILLVACGFSIHAYHTDSQYAGDDHRAATRFLAGRWRPGDAILVDAGYVYTALDYYWDGDPIAWQGRLVGPADAERSLAVAAARAPVVLLAGTVDGEATLGWGDPASDFYAMSRADTAEALDALFSRFNRLWLYRCYDTVTDPTAFIRGWLDEHGTRFEDQVFSGEAQLRVQGFVTDLDPQAGTETQDVALADGSLRLMGSTPLPAAVPAGGVLDLALAWRVGAMPADDRILFAGLFTGDGRRWAQTDDRPLGSLRPVASWTEGEAVRTPLRVPVPAGTPPGRYRLEVGWYRFVEAQPVWLAWTTGNLLTLGEVEVTAPEDRSSGTQARP